MKLHEAVCRDCGRNASQTEMSNAQLCGSCPTVKRAESLKFAQMG